MSKRLAIMVGHNKASQGASALKPIGLSEYRFHKEIIAPMMVAHAAKVGLETRVFLRDEGLTKAMADTNAWLKGHEGVCIELHFNASTPTGTGTEVLIDDTPSNRTFGKMVNDAIMGVLGLKQRHADTQGLKILKKGDRGHRNVTGITGTSCLVEPFFGSNANDCKVAWERREDYAKCLVNAAAAYLKAKPVNPPTRNELDKIPAEVQRAFALRAERAAKGLKGGKCNWIFEVDYSINAKFPRFFVYSIRDKKLYKYKCAHGIGGANKSPRDGRCREFSNTPGSFMSSLGNILTGPKIRSDATGISVRLNGLSPTNSNMYSRGCHLHGGSYVSDNEAGTDTSIPGFSQGCIVVDDKYINRGTGGELIEWLRDGSVGVAHYAGRFFVGKP